MSSLNNAFLRAYSKDPQVTRRDTRAAARPVTAPPADASDGAPPQRYAGHPGASPNDASADASATSEPPAVAPSPLPAALPSTAPAPYADPTVSLLASDRPRTAIDHPLYAPRHDAPHPTRLFSGVRVPKVAPHSPASPQLAAVALPTASVAASRSTAPATFLAATSVAPPIAPPIEPPTDDEFTPAWEVDAFQWSAGCRQVWQAVETGFRGLGEQLVAVNQAGLRTLGVTSARRAEGRSTVAICVARAAAEQGLSVLLVDADLDNPHLAVALGVDVQYDWTEVLTEALPLEEALIASLADPFLLAPLAGGVAGRSNLLRTPLFGHIVEQFQSLADLVLIDLPPCDEPLFALDRFSRSSAPSPLDATLVVRDARRLAVSEQFSAQRVAANVGAAVVGVIENFV